MNNKFYNNRGSVMILAIILMAIIMIVIPMISSQNIRQIKSTSNNHSEQTYKYAAEAGIDNVLALICQEIEDIDVSKKTMSYSSMLNNDKYPVVKQKLNLVLTSVKKLNVGNENKKLILEIEKAIDIEDVDELIKQIINIKQIALELTGNLCYESTTLRLEMYDILNQINSALDTSYIYNHSNHDSIIFTDKIDWQTIQKNNNLLGDLYSWPGDTDYNISHINNNEINSSKDEVDKIIGVIGWHPYGEVSKYIRKNIADGIIIIQDYITGGKAPSGSYRSIRDMIIDLQSTLSNYKSPYSEEFMQKKEDTCTTIDNVIKEINNLQSELYKIYTEKAVISGVTSKYPIEGIREHTLNVIKYLDIAKKNLIETKCKLKAVNISAGNSNEKYQIYISEKDITLNDNIKYKTNEISSEVEVISGIMKPLEVEIVSIGYNEDKTSENYEIKSKVVINGELEGNKIKVSYDIQSYSKNN